MLLLKIVFQGRLCKIDALNTHQQFVKEKYSNGVVIVKFQQLFADLYVDEPHEFLKF